MDLKNLLAPKPVYPVRDADLLVGYSDQLRADFDLGPILAGRVQVPVPPKTISLEEFKLRALLRGTAEDAALAGVSAREIAQHHPELRKPEPVTPEPVPTPVREPSPDGFAQPGVRPVAGEKVHAWNEGSGRCAVATILEVMTGTPNASVVVTATEPYLRILRLGETRVTRARFIEKPQVDESPGLRTPFVSWHTSKLCLWHR